MTSEGEDVSEITALTIRTESLNQSVDWWNSAMVWALIFAAIAAIAVVITTRIAITRAKLLADSQDALFKAKDAQLALDLKDKDKQIANANARTATLEHDTAKIRADAAGANERAARIEQTAAWRIISPKSNSILLSQLSSGLGGTVTLAYVGNDPESLFLASQLVKIFEAVNVRAARPSWRVDIQPRIYSRNIFFGVRVIGPQDSPAVTKIRESFLKAGIEFSNEDVPNIINDSPGIMISGGSTQGALIFVGSKRPL